MPLRSKIGRSSLRRSGTDDSGSGGGSALTETMNNAGPNLLAGSIVQMVGDLSFAAAQANSPNNVTGTIGVTFADIGAGNDGEVVTDGKARVLMAAGLVGVSAGDEIYVSTTAGKGTNVAPDPTVLKAVGVIKDASQYAIDGSVIADINIMADDVVPTTAMWPQGISRIYAVDFVNGLDTNKGYADPTTSSAADYAIACVSAGAAAKKTFAGLAAIFPRNGAGRQVEIIIANGGSNTAQNYAGSPNDFLDGCVGWSLDSPIVRGTGTNTTAGCVAFDGSANDLDYQGGITVTGLNVAGYNPTGAATTTSLPMLKVGGAAPALPAEPAAPLGWRVRFDANTATVALRNQCRQIAQVTGGTTVVPQTAFSAVPAVADVFYIEQAGVTFGAWTTGALGFGGQSSVSAQISGMRSTSTVTLVDSKTRFIFCGSNAFNSSGFALFSVGQSLLHPARGVRTIGGGMRVETTSLLNSGAGQVALAGLVTVGNFNPFLLNQLSWGSGCYSGNGVQLQNHSGPVGMDNTVSPEVGSATALASPRMNGRLRLLNSRVTVGGVDITGSAANASIQVAGCCLVGFFGGVVTGATGNNDVGMDLTLSRGSLIVITTAPTVTGALGDVRLAGGQIITWAQAAAGITDSAGNRLMSTSLNIPLSFEKFTGALFGGAALVTSQCSDTSPILLVANEVVPVRYPVSQRIVTRLRVMTLAASTNTIGNTVTLFKNGVATTMTINIPAATAAFTKFVDSTHPIIYADGDDLSLVMANAGADVAAVTKIGASIEYAV